ncbi:MULTISPECIES: LysR substrate-binding domain-containing protein [Agrobacterium]|uniref:LysR substrate-binding domain-containing protein n=1 Tax=Agrobacterium TaxID=357 RepID=UPI002FDD5260
MQRFGITYVPKALVEQQIADGQLRAVLDDWSLPFIGYHLYYPGRGQISQAMIVVVYAPRQRAKA